MTAGEYPTVADKGTSGGTAGLALYDGSGNLLTYGVAGGQGSGLDSIIEDFVAPATGTYYASVTGSTGLTYDMVAVEGGDFTTHGNSFANAQALNGASVVLGAIVPPLPPLKPSTSRASASRTSIRPTPPREPSAPQS